MAELVAIRRKCSKLNVPNANKAALCLSESRKYVLSHLDEDVWVVQVLPSHGAFASYTHAVFSTSNKAHEYVARAHHTAETMRVDCWPLCLLLPEEWCVVDVK